MGAESTRVLVVHRNREFARRLLKEISGADGLSVEFANPVEGLAPPLPKEAPGAIVLDLSLSVPEGYTIYRVLYPRGSHAAPIVVFRARAQQRTEVRNRERWLVTAGIESLEAHLHAALGRTPHQFSWLPVHFTGAQLVADLPNTHVFVDGRPISISAREGEVLGLLLSHCNELVRREVLILEIWGYETRSLDVHVRRLREKLGSAAGQLETVPSFGYRFIEPGFRRAVTQKEPPKFTRTKQFRRKWITQAQ